MTIAIIAGAPAGSRIVCRASAASYFDGTDTIYSPKISTLGDVIISEQFAGALLAIIAKVLQRDADIAREH